VTRLLETRADLDKRYVNRVRLGGIKFWLDGSLDTAWMTQPYATNRRARPASTARISRFPPSARRRVRRVLGLEPPDQHAHERDAAADQAIGAIEKAIAKHGMRDHRPVFVHATYFAGRTRWAN